MDIHESAAVQGTITYYDLRAEWFDKRFTEGIQRNPEFCSEVEAVRKAIPVGRLSGRVLELACGTGLFTQFIAPHCGQLDAVDVSAKSLSINRSRTKSPKVNYIQADIYDLKPEAKYDFVFFSFWLCHIPPARFQPFWQFLRSVLHESGSVFFIDGNRAPSPSGQDVFVDREHEGTVHKIVLVHDTPAELDAKICSAGWHGGISITPSKNFIYGNYTPVTTGAHIA